MKYSLFAGLVAALGHQATAQEEFNWRNVKPSTSLEYTPCYNGFKCARLNVPLDWLSNSTSVNGTAQATLAIATLPAKVPETDPSFGGTIILNPGGPSGSGVEFVIGVGPTLQAIADGTKHYEFLSFDPRGVGLTLPRSDCLNNEFARGILQLQSRSIGPLGSGEDVIIRQGSLLGAFGKKCQEDGTGIQAYMSTASVARDMVQIVDKIDELRNKNGTASAKLRMRGGPRSVRNDGVPRIQYWGFSYGTVLGNYFASMFPGRVGRMILEGVVDVHDYVAGEWSKDLQDTDKDLNTLWSTCFDAREDCALYKSTDTAAEDIQRRFEAFLDNLEKSPVQYVSESGIDEITRQDVIDIIFQALYNPISAFPDLAVALAQGIAGNFTALSGSLGLERSASDYCPSTTPQAYSWEQDAMFGVACGDAVSQAHMSTSDFKTYIDQLKSQSPKFGSSWGTKRLACKGWRVRPKYRFEGPFTTPAATSSGSHPVVGKPAAPILFLSSTYDPVTPLANAHAMSAEHPDSRVLVQDNSGHGTVFAPSKCKNNYVRKYFETGELPPEGTICKSDCQPFQDCTQATKRSLGGADVPELTWRRRGPLSI